MDTSCKLVNYQAYFLLATLEGSAALYFSIASKSMERNAWLFGFSLPRLLLGVALLGAVSILIWCSYKALFDRVWLARIATWVEAFISNRRRLLLSVLLLSLIAIASLALFYFWFSTRLASLPYVLQVAIERTLPALAWVSLLSIQTLGIISRPLREDFRTNLISQPERFRVVLLISSLIAAFTHWVILSFQLSVFKIQHWFWNFRDREPGIQELVFLVIFALVIVVLRMVIQNPEKGRRNVLMIVALGYLVQLGFGVAQGQGFESLRLKYLASGNSSFSKNACSEVGVLDSVRRYDELYGTGFWEGTKPPGLQALYILFGEVVKAVDPANSQEACIKNLTTIEAYVIPLLAMLTLFPLFLTGDLLGIERRVSYLAALLYITLPNFTQLPLFHDQFLFPLIFMSTVVLMIYAVRQKSLWLAAIAGIAIYVATFISFSLLPLLGFAFVWLIAQWSTRREPGGWADFLKSLAGILLGMAFATLVFYISFNYDPLRRYQAAFAHHREAKYFESGLAQLWQALLINNLEYLTLIGLPLTITVIYQCIASLLRYIGKQANKMDLFAIAIAITYLGINVLGQTRGEVARIWLFLAPAICLVGAYGLSNVFQTRRLPIYLVVGLQLVTAILVFQFQDYGCKLCP